MNPYKVLQLEPGADKQAVKKAYFKLIRQYSPEKAPEKFKEIREAYEYLQEQANFADVQKAVQLPEEFIKPYYQVLDWMKEKKYDKAISLSERVLSICEFQEFRVLLGKAYILNENSGKAVKLWEGLCNKNKDNIEYLEQLGEAYLARGWNNKAFQVYYNLYERKVENLPFYDRLIDITALQGAQELFREISSKVFDYYKRMEKHTREDTESMSCILYTISDYMSGTDSQWLLKHSDEILKIMTEVPMELKIYENTLLHNCDNLIDILEQNEAAESAVASYWKYITENERSIIVENGYQLLHIKVRLEEIRLKRVSLIHDIIKETSHFWYGRLINKALADKATNVELHMMELMMEQYNDESRLYDTLLYMVNDLSEILPSLLLVKKEYTLLGQAMGDYLEDMIHCNSQDYLFRKYEKTYKKLMGYPSGGRITISTEEEDNTYDSYENGTFQREGAKIGRNDPCPCGSGKKYKKCCGK
ncbi:MAG: hypothetical protein K0R34_3187 [Herbinix sp.]|jgi:tetratricopeptide (TPR) repeat protein|nr:hypothetical protein [Herbinix sp.]